MHVLCMYACMYECMQVRTSYVCMCVCVSNACKPNFLGWIVYVWPLSLRWGFSRLDFFYFCWRTSDHIYILRVMSKISFNNISINLLSLRWPGKASSWDFQKVAGESLIWPGKASSGQGNTWSRGWGGCALFAVTAGAGGEGRALRRHGWASLALALYLFGRWTNINLRGPRTRLVVKHLFAILKCFPDYLRTETFF